MKHKKLLVLITIILLIILFVVLYFIKLEQEKPVLKDSITIKSNGEVPSIKDYLKSGKIKDNYKITYYSSNKKIYPKVVYYNNKNEEVDKSTALKNNKLKKGYTKKSILNTPGKYKVQVQIGTKTYKSNIEIKDTTPPTLKLKEVEIKEGDNISIDNFIDKCTDNSNTKCIYNYVDDKKNILKDIDKSVGEHTVYIEAKDKSNNKIVVTTKLKVNKKEEEQVPTNTQSSTYTTTNRGSSSWRNDLYNTSGFDRSNPVAA